MQTLQRNQRKIPEITKNKQCDKSEEGLGRASADWTRPGKSRVGVTMRQQELPSLKCREQKPERTLQNVRELRQLRGTDAHGTGFQTDGSSGNARSTDG